MTTKEIKVGDIVKLKTIEEYKEAGDEITELVEMFAGQYGKVEHVNKEVNEFGERTYTIFSQYRGYISITDHEIAELYKKVEL